MNLSGRVFAPAIRGNASADKKVVESVENKKLVGESSGTTLEKEVDDILKIIKMSDYKIVYQLLHTPSNISILALLMNSSSHRESLMRVLDQAFVESDMSLDQFSNVVGNITSCNNLSFCDDELPDEGRNHNLALHISMCCTPKFALSFLKGLSWTLRIASVKFQVSNYNFSRKSFTRAEWSKAH